MVTVPKPDHYWNFNGNANDVIGSANGTVSGASLTTDFNGKTDSAYLFDGNSQQIEIPSSTTLFRDTFTISFRAKPIATSNNYGSFIVKGTSAGGKSAYDMYLSYNNDGATRFLICDGTSSLNQETDTGTIKLDVYQNFTFTFDYNVTNGMKTYVNGLLIKEETCTVRMAQSFLFYFGQNGINTAYGMKGNLDYVKLWVDSALSPEEVYQDYMNEKDPRNACVLDLKLTEGTGTTAYDGSGNGNDATITGATWAEGKFGKCLSFDGTDDYAKGYSTKPYGDNYTIITWIKSSNLAQGTSYLVGDQGMYGSSRGWQLRTNNALIDLIISNGTKYHQQNSAFTLVSGELTCVAMSLTNSEYKMYINFEEKYSGTPSSVGNADQGYYFTMGRTPYSASAYWEGENARTGIYTRILTQEEIMQEAYRIRPTSVGGPVCTDDLELYLPLNGDVKDYSSNGLTVTQNGTSSYEDAPIGGEMNVISTTQYLSVSAGTLSASTFNSEGAIGGWLYLTSEPDNGDNFIGWCGRTYIKIRQNDGVCEAYHYDGSDNKIAGIKIEINKLYHFMMCWDSNTLSFYVNSILMGSTNAGAATVQDSRPFIINGVGGSNFESSRALIGYQDNIQIYSRALSADEVRAIYSRDKQTIDVR